jgi:hypothetical protein
MLNFGSIHTPQVKSKRILLELSVASKRKVNSCKKINYKKKKLSMSCRESEDQGFEIVENEFGLEGIKRYENIQNFRIIPEFLFGEELISDEDSQTPAEIITDAQEYLWSQIKEALNSL